MTYRPVWPAVSALYCFIALKNVLFAFTDVTLIKTPSHPAHFWRARTRDRKNCVLHSFFPGGGILIYLKLEHDDPDDV